MLKKINAVFVNAYLLIMFCIYPFYIQDGYLDIGEAKNRFFIRVSIAAFALFLIGGFFSLISFMRERGEGKRPYLIDWDRVSGTDLMVMLYATSVFWSYVVTEYRQEALWGTDGWYMGCVPLILLCGLYFAVSRVSGLRNGGRLILYGNMAASGIVFLIGICNRFSFYPIRFEITQPDFISTLGNINWYCGYLSVVAPAGICLFLFGQKEKAGAIWKKGLCGLYTVISFMAGFCQGSSSVFLWFGALFLILFWIALDKGEGFSDLLFLIFLWGISAQLVRLMRFMLPGRYNYDLDNLCGYFTDSSLTIWISLGAAIIYTAVRKCRGKAEGKHVSGRGKLWIPVPVLASAALWLILSVINTGWGIPGLQDKSLFLLRAEWGNGRGAAFYAGVRIWKEMPLIHKLLGAGPDCFSRYAYSIPEVAAVLRENFGADRLSNAHNELLTGLVNTGIAGVCFYTGIFVFFIRSCAKAGKENPEIYLFGVCAFCYLVHNMVSFAQVLNLPFVFLLMGMGEAAMRKIQKGRLTSP